MILKTRKFDVAELLDTDEGIRAFLEDVAEDGTPQEFIRALNVAARATDSQVEISLEDEQLTMKPSHKRYTLAELLEDMKEGDTLNIDETFERSPPVGNEAT